MITVDNAVATYYDDIQRAGDLCRSESQAAVSDGAFKPSLSLPPLDDRLEHFFSPSTIQIADLGRYHGVSLRLLDLT
jgi:Family of unknown function (DUF6002)